MAIDKFDLAEELEKIIPSDHPLLEKSHKRKISIIKERKVKYTALFDGLVDLVEDKGKPAFLVKEDNRLKILPEVSRDNVLYVPPPRDNIPWLLPNGERVIEHYRILEEFQKDSYKALYEDLISYHKRISDLPGEEFYDLIVSWDFHTYLLDFDNTQYSPIIHLFAVPERGKSRTGKAMVYVAYRGIQVECLREAYILRLANDYRATIFFDIMDIWRKAERNGSEDILLHRYEKGAKVPRVLYPERGAYRDTVYYDVFGATIIASNVGVHKILETRAILCNMLETRKRFEEDIKAEDALPLKERLVAFRAECLGGDLVDISKPVSGRLGDILKPLYQVILLINPEKKEAFLKFAKELELDRRVEKSISFEAQLIRIIAGLEDRVEKGILPIKLITDTFNRGKSENQWVTYQRIGRVMKSLGFKTGKTSDGASAIIWDEEKLSLLKETYGLHQTSEIPETSETPEELSLAFP
jgi:hypothetical protein